MTYNPILNTDSYKFSHFLFYPEESKEMYSYLESRGGRYPYTMFFGLQPILDRFAIPVTEDHVKEAKRFNSLHGTPFNYDGWMYIVKQHQGRLPVEIKSVLEGTRVPTRNAMVTIRNTDPACAWLTSYLETALLRVWYPTTVATRIDLMKKKIKPFFEETSDNLQNLQFALIDFSSRGSTSYESSEIGGSAYLVHFQGSDNVPAVQFTNENYSCEMSGFSIPATEHSIMCSFGEEDEKSSLEYIISKIEDGGVVSIVSDTWNIYRACEYLVEMSDMIKSRNITVVVRPDSGEIDDVLPEVIRIISNGFGTITNSKGYGVINNAKILWGDGIDEENCDTPFEIAKEMGISADSVLTGSGGGLMQKDIDRDTCKFAVKGSNIIVGNESRPIAKDPITDLGKRSKKGKFVLLENRTFTIEESLAMDDVDSRNMLQTSFLNGKVIRRQSIDDIRNIANRE